MDHLLGQTQLMELGQQARFLQGQHLTQALCIQVQSEATIALRPQIQCLVEAPIQVYTEEALQLKDTCMVTRLPLREIHSNLHQLAQVLHRVRTLNPPTLLLLTLVRILLFIHLTAERLVTSPQALHRFIQAMVVAIKPPGPYQILLIILT